MEYRIPTIYDCVFDYLIPLANEGEYGGFGVDVDTMLGNGRQAWVQVMKREPGSKETRPESQSQTGMRDITLTKFALYVSLAVIGDAADRYRDFGKKEVDKEKTGTSINGSVYNVWIIVPRRVAIDDDPDTPDRTPSHSPVKPKSRKAIKPEPGTAEKPKVCSPTRLSYYTCHRLKLNSSARSLIRSELSRSLHRRVRHKSQPKRSLGVRDDLPNETQRYLN
jgi:hypothetical protein